MLARIQMQYLRTPCHSKNQITEMSEHALTRFDCEKHCLPDGGSWHWRQQPVLTAFQSLGGFCQHMFYFSLP
jgi:hypothetical protein